MREEMTEVIKGLSDETPPRIRLDGTKPLTESESKLIRHKLATKLGLPPTLFDSVKDELRVLQRTVVLQLAKESDAREVAEESPAEVEEGMAFKPLQSTKAKPAQVTVIDDSAVRDHLMEMQGQGKPKEEESTTLTQLKKKHKAVMQKKITIDDDYLCGPLTVDTYVTYRARPIITCLERRARKLASRLNAMEIVIFCVQSAGALLATFKFTEWIALTVAISAVLAGFIEFNNLNDHLTTINIALKDLETAMTKWDSLSIVKRRTGAAKMEIVLTTEDALLSVVDAHTTASSNAIVSVTKQLAGEKDDEEE